MFSLQRCCCKPVRQKGCWDVGAPVFFFFYSNSGFSFNPRTAVWPFSHDPASSKHQFNLLFVLFMQFHLIFFTFRLWLTVYITLFCQLCDVFSAFCFMTEWKQNRTVPTFCHRRPSWTVPRQMWCSLTPPLCKSPQKLNRLPDISDFQYAAIQ